MAKPDVSLAWSTQQGLAGRKLADDSASEVSFEGEESDHIVSPKEGALSRRDGSVASIGSDSSHGLSASSSGTASSIGFDDVQEVQAARPAAKPVPKRFLQKPGKEPSPEKSNAKRPQRKEQNQRGADGKAKPKAKVAPTNGQKAKVAPTRSQKSPKARDLQGKREDDIISFGERSGDDHPQAAKHQHGDSVRASRLQNVSVDSLTGESAESLPRGRSFAENEESPQLQVQRIRKSAAAIKTPSQFLKHLEQKYGGFTRAFDTMGAQAAMARPRGMAAMTQGAALDPSDFEIACERLDLLGPGNALDMFHKLDFDGGKAGRHDNCLTIVDLLNGDRKLRSVGSKMNDPSLLSCRLFYPEYTKPSAPPIPPEMFAEFLSPYEQKAMFGRSAGFSPQYSAARSPEFGGSPFLRDPLSFDGSLGLASSGGATTVFRHPAGPRRLRAA
mmetsp:Transcript_43268/g.80604  ORF Transcript_43268/g.80604 Transcript_43268/m.80604 type:complete len:444 (-) Transcript_43268:12-1343(-)